MIPFREGPSIFYFLPGDRSYFLFAALGVLLSLAVLTGVSEAI